MPIRINKIFGFKDVDSSVLIMNILNSLLNSFSLLKKFYEISPNYKSTIQTFIGIMGFYDTLRTSIDDIFLALISAAAHDFMKGICIDVRKFMFLISLINKDDDDFVDRNKATCQIHKLQTDYDKFLKQKTNENKLLIMKRFILFHAFEERIIISCDLVVNLIDRLRFTMHMSLMKDCHIILILKPNEFESTDKLTRKYFNIILRMMKAAITPINDYYLCTDIIAYRYSSKQSNIETVYYDMMHETLIDSNRIKWNCKLSSLFLSKTYDTFEEYSTDRHTDILYVPFILHYHRTSNLAYHTYEPDKGFDEYTKLCKRVFYNIELSYSDKWYKRMKALRLHEYYPSHHPIDSNNNPNDLRYIYARSNNSS